MEANLLIDTTKMPRPEVCHNGVRIAVGEIQWTDEEAKKLFTDSDGRVHGVVFLDPDTGERRFGR